MSYITSSLVTSCDNYVLGGQKPLHKSHNHVTIRDVPLDSRLKQPRKLAITANVELKGENQDGTAKGFHVFSQDNLKFQCYKPHGGENYGSKHQHNKMKGEDLLNTQESYL